MRSLKGGKRSALVIAFPKAGTMGHVLAWICSWLVPVLITLKAKSSVQGAPIFVLQRGRYRAYNSSYNEKLAMEHLGWRFFRRHYGKSATSHVRFRCGGLDVDYAPCLLKAVTNQMTELISFRVAARRLGLGRSIYGGCWLPPGRANARRSPLELFLGPGQWVAECGDALAFLGLATLRIVRALLKGARDGRHCRTLWLGIGTNEYGELGERRSFYWPERLDHGLRILYVLPRVPQPEFQNELRNQGIQWVSQYDILQFCGKGRLILLAVQTIWTACSMLLPWRGSFRYRARLCGLHFEALTWAAFSDAVSIKLAVTNSSNWRSTRPILVVLKRAGVKSALWYFAANAVRFQHPGGSVTANGRFKAYHEAERIYVWNRLSAEWTGRILGPHAENEIRVTGPLMSGDAGLCMRTPVADTRIRIGIFDASMPAGGSDSFFGALHLSEYFFDQFWKDIARLAREIPEIALILKPKKALKGARRQWSFSTHFWSIIDDANLKAAGRIELIDNDADPYAAIARCDAAIGMPFTSPCQAAMHFGRTGIYYDPTGIVGIHHYHDLGKFFCRSYEELAALIRELIENKRAGRGAVLPDAAAWFTGVEPGADPQRVFLEDLADWIGPPDVASTHREDKPQEELIGA